MNTKFLSRAVIGVLSCATALACVAPAGAQEAAERSGQTPAAAVLYFQDGHEIAPVQQKKDNVPNSGEHGGIARLATVLTQERAKGVPTDTAFGGDLGGGTIGGVFFRGSAMVDGFNKVGVNVAGLGQHDFDFGLEQMFTNVKASQFDWVNSNLTMKNAPILGDDHVALTRTVGGVKIGYIGLTADMASSTVVKDVTQQDFVESAKAAVARLNDADVIVALAQIPLEEGQKVMAAVPEITAMLREENKAIQEGNDLTTLEDGRVIVAPEGNYGSVERIDFTRVDSRYVPSVTSIQVDESVADDPALRVLQDKYTSDLESTLGSDLSCRKEALTRPQPLGKLTADAFREKAGADFGWINAGGLRKDLPGGKITVKNAYEVLPYSNKLMKIEVTGAELRLGLEQAAMSDPSGGVKIGAGYPLVSGLSFTFTEQSPEGSRITDLKKADGTAITDDALYTLALTNYVYGGGNKVVAFQKSKVINDAGTIGSDFDALADYLRGHSDCEAPQPQPIPNEHPGNMNVAFDAWDLGSHAEPFFYGRAGDEVIAGDWNGDGKDTLAIRRGNVIHFRDSLSNGEAEFTVAFGRAGDQLLAGDWNGDGKDTLAVRRGNMIYLKDTLASGEADSSFAYGKVGDVALAGDWNGDGKDTVAVRRAQMLFVKNDLTGGQAEVSLAFGKPSDALVAGDWNGDRRDTVAVYRAGEFFLINELREGEAPTQVTLPEKFESVVVGDWDADRVDTPLARR